MCLNVQPKSGNFPMQGCGIYSMSQPGMLRKTAFCFSKTKHQESLREQTHYNEIEKEKQNCHPIFFIDLILVQKAGEKRKEMNE